MGGSGEEDNLLEGDLPGAEEGVQAPLGDGQVQEGCHGDLFGEGADEPVLVGLSDD